MRAEHARQRLWPGCVSLTYTYTYTHTRARSRSCAVRAASGATNMPQGCAKPISAPHGARPPAAAGCARNSGQRAQNRSVSCATRAENGAPKHAGCCGRGIRALHGLQSPATAGFARSSSQCAQTDVSFLGAAQRARRTAHRSILGNHVWVSSGADPTRRALCVARCAGVGPVTMQARLRATRCRGGFTRRPQSLGRAFFLQSLAAYSASTAYHQPLFVGFESLGVDRRAIVTGWA
jgi:hypothetical protein